MNAIERDNTRHRIYTVLAIRSSFISQRFGYEYEYQSMEQHVKSRYKHQTTTSVMSQLKICCV